MQEMQVWSLGREDPWVLEKEMASHSSSLDWKIPWAEEPGNLQSAHGATKSQTSLSNWAHKMIKADLSCSNNCMNKRNRFYIHLIIIELNDDVFIKCINIQVNLYSFFISSNLMFESKNPSLENQIMLTHKSYLHSGNSVSTLHITKSLDCIYLYLNTSWFTLEAVFSLKSSLNALPNLKEYNFIF